MSIVTTVKERCSEQSCEAEADSDAAAVALTWERTLPLPPWSLGLEFNSLLDPVISPRLLRLLLLDLPA